MSRRHRSRIVAIEVIVEPVEVPVPPVAIPVEVTHVQVVVRVAVACNVPPLPPLLEYSWSCIEFGISNTLARHTKYLHF